MGPLMIQQERIVKELVQGQDYASQLQFLLHKSVDQDENFIHGDVLVLKILTSFTEALSLLGSSAPASDSVVTSQVDSGFSEDSGDSRKRPSSATTATSTTKPPASYKRKKTSNSVIKVSPTIEDGHAWRKYGQKDILNAKYPRSYYRCAHKYKKGCEARKQVQRKEDDPDLYVITYISPHSCSPFLNLPHILSPLQPNSPNSDPPNNYTHPIMLSAPTINEQQCNPDDDHHTQYSLWKDVLPSVDHRTASPTFDSIDFEYFGDQFGFTCL